MHNQASKLGSWHKVGGGGWSLRWECELRRCENAKNEFNIPDSQKTIINKNADLKIKIVSFSYEEMANKMAITLFK